MAEATDKKYAEEKNREDRIEVASMGDFSNMYNFKKDFKYSYKTQAGLTPDVVREISEKKNEPKWMLDFRLKSLELYYQIDYPN